MPAQRAAVRAELRQCAMRRRAIATLPCRGRSESDGVAERVHATRSSGLWQASRRPNPLRGLCIRAPFPEEPAPSVPGSGAVRRPRRANAPRSPRARRPRITRRCRLPRADPASRPGRGHAAALRPIAPSCYPGVGGTRQLNAVSREQRDRAVTFRAVDHVAVMWRVARAVEHPTFRMESSTKPNRREERRLRQGEYEVRLAAVFSDGNEFDPSLRR